MQGIIGKKAGMTRIFADAAGKSVPVTVIAVEPNLVHQVKTIEKDGYSAVQLGYGTVAERKLAKPQVGHFKKLNTPPTKLLREFRPDADEKLNAGDKIGVGIFENVKYVTITGVSKGRGFTGCIKRHNFQRGRETHGNTNHREHGSIGSNTSPGRVFPGVRMAGQYGASQVTVKNLEVVGIDKDANLMYVKGAVPGHKNGVLLIKKNPV
jgi:large subunit ribosomal protein L3